VKRFLMMLTLLLVTAGLVGCGDSGGANGNTGGFVATGNNNTGAGSGDLIFNFIQAQDITVPVGTVDLKFDFFSSGNTIIFSETLSFAAQVIFQDVSSNVVRVEVTAINGDGFPIALGTATVNIENGTEQVVTLDVTPITLDAIVVTPQTVGLVVAATQQLAAQGFWSNGFIANLDVSTLTYSGNDAGVATVSNSGLITGVAVGGTTLTVSYTVAGTTTQVDSNPVPISVVGGAIALTGSTNTFNTDNGELNGVVHPGWDGAVLQVESFDLAAGALVNVTGDAAFQLVTSGNINIDGTLDVAGQKGGNNLGGCDADGGLAGIPGPGGFAGGAGGGLAQGTVDGANGEGPGAGQGAGGGTTDQNNSSSGGGAGHLDPGTDGQQGAEGTPGSGGVAYSSIPTVLIGGSGGGGAASGLDSALPLDSGDDGGGGGGGGGGAARLTAMGTLTVSATGVIDASGGDGGNGCGGNSGGGGAGSGGSIELFAPLVPTVDGLLDVSGGSGGGGTLTGGAASDGRSLVGII
jgi:hypothetical protein